MKNKILSIVLSIVLTVSIVLTSSVYDTSASTLSSSFGNGSFTLDYINNELAMLGTAEYQLFSWIIGSSASTYLGSKNYNLNRDIDNFVSGSSEALTYYNNLFYNLGNKIIEKIQRGQLGEYTQSLIDYYGNVLTYVKSTPTTSVNDFITSLQAGTTNLNIPVSSSLNQAYTNMFGIGGFESFQTIESSLVNNNIIIPSASYSVINNNISSYGNHYVGSKTYSYKQGSSYVQDTYQYQTLVCSSDIKYLYFNTTTYKIYLTDGERFNDGGSSSPWNFTLGSSLGYFNYGENIYLQWPLNTPSATVVYPNFTSKGVGTFTSLQNVSELAQSILNDLYINVSTNDGYRRFQLKLTCPIDVVIGNTFEDALPVTVIDNLGFDDTYTTTTIDNVSVDAVTKLSDFVNALDTTNSIRSALRTSTYALTDTLVSTNDWTTTIDEVSNVPASSSDISFPVLTFSRLNSYITYLWNMTKPLIQYSKSFLDCLTFDGSGIAWIVYGAVSVGLIGGCINKFLK